MITIFPARHDGRECGDPAKDRGQALWRNWGQALQIAIGTLEKRPIFQCLNFAVAVGGDDVV